MIILGRKDNQVKLRGLRIELGEIEKCLTNISGIRQATVVIRKLGKEDAICAYYTADTQMDVEALKAEMKKTLTDYMIPASFNQMDEMPLTPNGKINFKALKEPVMAEKADKEHYSISYGDVFANPTPRMLAKLVSTDEDSYGFEDLEAYDYGPIEEVLQKNTLENCRNGQKQEIGDVILTGATGFLGIHILCELLKNYQGKVYCLLRGGEDADAYNRLQTIFYYYFEERLEECYADRIVVVNGDITNRASLDNLLLVHADTFINCAANVKHFSKGTDIEDVNYHGVQNILNFCEKTGIRLVHVSTMSIGGVFVDEPGEVKGQKDTRMNFAVLLQTRFRSNRSVMVLNSCKALIKCQRFLTVCN